MNSNSIQTRTRQQITASSKACSPSFTQPNTTSAIHASVNHALAWFGLGIAGMSCGGDLTPPTHF
jgi:hypothetical protein